MLVTARRTSLPAGALHVNRASPQARGLVLWWNALASGKLARFCEPVRGDHGSYNAMAFPYSWHVDALVGGMATFTPANAEYIRNSSVLTHTIGAISAWIKILATPASDMFVVGRVNGNGSSTKDMVLYVDTSRYLRFYGYDGVERTTGAGASVIPTGQAVHVCGVADGLNINCYLNGILAASTPCSAMTSSFTVANIILGGSDNARTYFSGHAGEVRVYNRPLSAAEVWALYDPATRWELYRAPYQPVVKAPTITATAATWFFRNFILEG